ncbi:MAG: hypothetical protein Q8K64_12410 [Sediminibacterium sp.]|nr:hypothetical protein [Sediminibacterium sp.]
MNYSQEFLDLLFAADDTITHDNVLDFKSLPEGIPTANFTDFVYRNFNNPNNPIHIEPFELFLIKNDDVNAFACRDNGLNIITIYLSLFKAMEDRLVNEFPDLSNESSAIMKQIRPALIKGKEGITPDFLLYQNATLFTYYHELGHLNQMSHASYGALGRLVKERYCLVKGKEFDQVAHAMEIDADLFAANFISGHIRQFWDELPSEHRSPDNLLNLIAIACASIFVFFHVISEGWDVMYFLDFDHPHPVIRISYIADSIVTMAAKDVAVSRENCIHLALVIATDLMKYGKVDGIPDYIKLYRDNQDSISRYIHDEMSPFMKALSFLIQNKA